MKKTFIAIVILLFFCSETSPQQKLSITASGSINYIPMKEFSNYLTSLSRYATSSVDKISFGGSIQINYYFHKNHNIYISADYLSSNASLDGGFAVVKWIFQTIPISTGYEYSRDILKKSLRFNIGGGIIYSFFENNEKINSDTGYSSRNYADNSWGFEINSGIEKSILKNIILITGIKYRYLGDYKLDSYNNFDEVNLSGLGMFVAITFKII